MLQKKGQLNFIISKEFIGKATILFFFLPNSNILQYFFHLDADNEANVCCFFFTRNEESGETARLAELTANLHYCIVLH